MTQVALEPLKWVEPLNPKDEVDYTFDLQGNLLEVGETIQTWSLTLSPVSIAAGLLVGSGDYATAMNGTVMTVWFSVDPAQQDNARFDDVGVWLDMQIEVTTTNTPPRVRNRTLLLHVSRQ